MAFIKDGHSFTKVIHGKGVSFCVHCERSLAAYKYAPSACRFVRVRNYQPTLLPAVPALRYQPPPGVPRSSQTCNSKAGSCQLARAHSHGPLGTIFL